MADKNSLAKRIPIKDWPTGKQHISFSELSTWRECMFRYKLAYIDKLSKDSGDTPHIHFGTAMHAAIQHYLETREIKKEIAYDIITKSWDENPEFVTGPFPEWALDGFGELKDWIEKANRILTDLPEFLEKEYPGWKYVCAEENLMESIDDQDLKFKGFIDAVIKYVNKKGKTIYLIIDWKTCGWGWSKDQMRDPIKQLQPILYKHFWSRKHNVPLKDIRCAFGLLKRDGKPGKSIQMIPVSVGPVTLGRALKVIDSHVTNVSKGRFLKNRDACKFCEFANTKHCPQSF